MKQALLFLALFCILPAFAGQTNYTPNIGTLPLTTPIIVVPPTNTPTDGQILSATGNHTKWVTAASGSGTGDALVANPLSQFAATTSAQLRGVVSDETGSGLAVFATSPTLTTPILGVAAATTINKLTLTTPASGSTLTIVDGKTLTVSKTMTLTSTGDSGVITLPNATATIPAISDNLSVFAATTSAQLLGVLSDETGSGPAVFGTAPTLTSALVASGLNGGQAPSTNWNLLSISNGTATASSLASGSNIFQVQGIAGDKLFEVASNEVVTVKSNLNVGNNLNVAGTGTFQGDGPSIFNGGITNHGVLDQFGRQTNYDVVIGTAQTNSGNIQTATLNTTGAASVAGAATFTGNVSGALSNYWNFSVVGGESVPTNILTSSVVDFAKAEQTFQTNNVINILGFTGKDATGKTTPSTLLKITNSAGLGAAFQTNVVFPANTRVIGNAVITNWMEWWIEFVQPTGPTNAWSLGGW